MATISGGSYITDTHSGSILHGDGGNDVIFANFDHDMIFGGGGNDLIETTGSHETIFGQ